MAIHEFNGMHYHIDDKLIKFWSKCSLKILKRTNSDRVFIVDGRERVGKSTWAFQQGCYLDESLKDQATFLSRICFSPEEFDKAVRNTRNGVIFFDEAFRGFSSRAALSKTNKKLIATLMEMGQNNNIVFIILPSFFMLDIYPAMLRSNNLFNIYLDKKTNKRTFRGYNYKDKNKTYQIGTKRGWSYPFDTRFKGRFYNNANNDKFPGGHEWFEAYQKKKSSALHNMELELQGNQPEESDKWEDRFYKVIFDLQKQLKISDTKFAVYLNGLGIPIGRSTIGVWKEKAGKTREKPPIPLATL